MADKNNFVKIVRRRISVTDAVSKRIEELGAPYKMDFSNYVNKVLVDHIQGSHLPLDLTKK